MLDIHRRCSCFHLIVPLLSSLYRFKNVRFENSFFAGIELSKPDFMESRVKRTVAPPREPVFTSSGSDSDVEWGTQETARYEIG